MARRVSPIARSPPSAAGRRTVAGFPYARLAELLELREVVRDLEPGRFRPHVDVARRADRRLVDERAERHVDVLPVPHDRVEQRPAGGASRVVEGLLTVDEQCVRAPGQLELLPLDAGKRLERRSGRSATARAMAVRRVAE